jgi:hypothetical protein
MLLKSLTALSFVSVAVAHGAHDHDQEPMAGPLQSLWYNTLPGDGGKQVKTVPLDHCRIATLTNIRPTLSSQASVPLDVSPTSLA